MSRRSCCDVRWAWVQLKSTSSVRKVMEVLTSELCQIHPFPREQKKCVAPSPCHTNDAQSVSLPRRMKDTKSRGPLFQSFTFIWHSVARCTVPTRQLWVLSSSPDEITPCMSTGKIQIKKFMIHMASNCGNMQEFPCFSSTMFNFTNKIRLEQPFIPNFITKTSITHNKQSRFHLTDKLLLWMFEVKWKTQLDFMHKCCWFGAHYARGYISNIF